MLHMNFQEPIDGEKLINKFRKCRRLNSNHLITLSYKFVILLNVRT